MSPDDIDFDLDREFQKHLDYLAGTDFDEPFPTQEEINAAIDFFGEDDLGMVEEQTVNERDFNDIQYPKLK